VPAEALMGTAMETAQKIAAGPLNAYAMSKALFNQYAAVDLAQMLNYEARDQAKARMHPNGGEGLNAFLEKRPAKFT
jgi:enoyl-CoA hydratase/carnithine racemase